MLQSIRTFAHSILWLNLSDPTQNIVKLSTDRSRKRAKVNLESHFDQHENSNFEVPFQAILLKEWRTSDELKFKNQEKCFKVVYVITEVSVSVPIHSENIFTSFDVI